MKQNEAKQAKPSKKSEDFEAKLSDCYSSIFSCEAKQLVIFISKQKCEAK